MKKPVLILGLILVLALFLRLFRLAELFHFTMDEELIAWRAYGLFKLHRPFLLGGISPLQIHLPPYFYYFSSLLLWTFKLNPLGWGLWAGLFSLITVVFLYKLSRNLLAPLLYTVSLTAVLFDRHFWPLFFNPLFLLLTLWALRKKRYLILMLTLVSAVTADPSNLALVLFVLLFNSKAFFKYTWLGAGIFLLPLLAFDLRHQWQNFLGLTRLFNRLGAGTPNFNGFLLLPQSLARFWYTAQTNIIEVYSYCIPYTQARLSEINIWLLILAVMVIIFTIRRHRETKLLLFSYFISLGFFGILGFSLFDHYLTALMPVWAIITAAAIKALPKKPGFLIVLIFVFTNLFQFSRITNPYGLKYKQELITWANQQLNGQNFNLESVSKCHRENGLRYLFELSGHPPQQSFMDSNFAWLYPSAPSASPASLTLLVTDNNDHPLLPVISTNSFGALKAYLMENSDSN